MLENSQNEIKVLDSGFVRLVDHMGNDKRVCNTARVSYQNNDGSFDEIKDRKLIRYMMKHKHTSPFEMVTFIFHCKMPLFVARQWVRTRTASLNEVSGRYSELKREYYSPDIDRIQKQSTTNKQGSEDGDFNIGEREGIIQRIKGGQNYATNEYQSHLDHNVARELARINLPLSIYTEFYWKMDLHNLFNFLRLRMDSHAQWEIQQYANSIAELIKPIVPISFEAFEDYILYSEIFSRQEMAIIKSVMDDFSPFNDIKKPKELSDREFKDFKKKMNI